MNKTVTLPSEVTIYTYALPSLKDTIWQWKGIIQRIWFLSTTVVGIYATAGIHGIHAHCSRLSTCRMTPGFKPSPMIFFSEQKIQHNNYTVFPRLLEFFYP